MLSRELSLYLEHQVRVGFLGSGVGLSLILGFSVAYACYYLGSIAKVSRGEARAPGRRAKGGFRRIGRSPRLVAGWSELAGDVLGASVLLLGVALPPASDGRPWGARGRAGQPLSACLWSGPVLGPQPGPSDLGARGAAVSLLSPPAKLLGNAGALFKATYFNSRQALEGLMNPSVSPWRL